MPYFRQIPAIIIATLTYTTSAFTTSDGHRRPGVSKDFLGAERWTVGLNM